MIMIMNLYLLGMSLGWRLKKKNYAYPCALVYNPFNICLSESRNVCNSLEHEMA